MKTLKDAIGNRTRVLPACNADMKSVPCIITSAFSLFLCVCELHSYFLSAVLHYRIHSKVSHAVKLLTCIRQTQVSNLGRGTDCP